MNILVTNNHVIYNSHNPDIDHKKEPAKNPGDSDFFYRLCPVLSDDFCICVHVHNALCRASPISTCFLKLSVKTPALCQCPISGFSHFYVILWMGVLYSAAVSMPYIGLPPFLRHYRLGFREIYICVNALYRASPISTNISSNYHTALYRVNALYRASPISTHHRRWLYRAGIYCVNALYRASPISTLSLQKPFKINGFRDRFQGVIVRKF